MTLTPHSIIHGDACFAYFNKIWGIPRIAISEGRVNNETVHYARAAHIKFAFCCLFSSSTRNHNHCGWHTRRSRVYAWCARWARRSRNRDNATEYGPE